MEKSTGFTVLQSPLLDNIVKKFSSTCIFHNQEKLLRSFYNLIQLNYIRMSDYFQNVDLSHHSCNISLVLNLVLFEDLDGYFLLRQLMNTFSDFTKRSRSNSFSDHVIANETIVGSFLPSLSSLSTLNVTNILLLLLLFELSQCLSQASLEALTLCHFLILVGRVMRSLRFLLYLLCHMLLCANSLFSLDVVPKSPTF